MPTDLTVMELEADPERQFSDQFRTTGIYVRAKLDGNWSTYDIAQLTRDSLLKWLRSRGGSNPWAEDAVGIILGHGHLHREPLHEFPPYSIDTLK